jgi:hypothetical protein
MRPPPRRKDFGDAPIGVYLDALEDWLLASRVLFQPSAGIRFTETAGGIVPFLPPFTSSPIMIFKTTAAGTGRSGTTAGTVACKIINVDGADLSDEGATVDVHPIVPGSPGSGKYGLGGVTESGDYYALFEC